MSMQNPAQARADHRRWEESSLGMTSDPRLEAALDAERQYTTGGMCHFGVKCEACDCWYQPGGDEDRRARAIMRYVLAAADRAPYLPVASTESVGRDRVEAAARVIEGGVYGYILPHHVKPIDNARVLAAAALAAADRVDPFRATKFYPDADEEPLRFVCTEDCPADCPGEHLDAP